MGPEYNQSVQSIQNGTADLSGIFCWTKTNCNFVFECIWKDWGHLHCNALEAIKSMKTCKANASPKDLHCDQQQIDAKFHCRWNISAGQEFSLDFKLGRSIFSLFAHCPPSPAPAKIYRFQCNSCMSTRHTHTFGSEPTPLACPLLPQS